eukprot:gene8580-7829_t
MLAPAPAPPADADLKTQLQRRLCANSPAVNPPAPACLPWSVPCRMCTGGRLAKDIGESASFIDGKLKLAAHLAAGKGSMSVADERDAR